MPAKYHKAGKLVQICTGCGASVTSKIHAVQSIRLSTTKYTYNGKKKKPEVVVLDAQGEELAPDVDYSVKYSKGRREIGSYQVTITFTGDYTGTKTRTFKILPGKVKDLKATAGKNRAQLTWSPVNGATNYIVYYAGSKDGPFKKAFTTKGTSATVMKLTANKIYYFRIRAVAKLEDGNFKGSPSAVKKARAK